LAELFDEGLKADLFAVFHRHLGPSLTVRVATGWEEHTAWTTRLIGLAGAHPRLKLSLPFAADDDVAGSRSTAVLTGLLGELGQTPEDCGDVSVESSAPRDAVPSVNGELPLTTEALDWLEQLLTSPGWGPGSEPTVAAAGHASI
jgi:hypothetical protein